MGVDRADREHQGLRATRQADLDAGSIHNAATVRGTTGTGGTVTGTASATVPVGVVGGLAVRKDAALADANGNGKADVGETITYTFRVTNTGVSAQDGIALSDPLLAAAGIAPACPGTTLASSQSMTCTAAPYRVTARDVAGTSVPVAGTSTPVVRNVLTASAHVLADGSTVTATAQAETPSQPQAAKGLLLAKAVTPGVVQAAGQVLLFSYTLTNNGTQPVSSIVITDPLQAGGRLVGLETCGTGVTLAVGDQLRCYATYTVSAADMALAKSQGAAALAALLTSTAQATGVTPYGGTVSAYAAAPVEVDLNTVPSVVKSAELADANHNGIADAGETIVYRFVVNNNAGTGLVDVVVVDAKLAAAGVAITCPKSTLATDESMTCTSGAYTVTPADITDGIVRNSAYAAARTVDGKSNHSRDTGAVVITNRTGTVTHPPAPPTPPAPPAPPTPPAPWSPPADLPFTGALVAGAAGWLSRRTSR